MSLGNQSPSQAVLNMYIIDTVIYNQKRSLPLQMQKKYVKELSRLRKLKAVLKDSTENGSEDNGNDESSEVSRKESVDCEGLEVSEKESNSEENESVKDKDKEMEDGTATGMEASSEVRHEEVQQEEINEANEGVHEDVEESNILHAAEIGSDNNEHDRELMASAEEYVKNKISYHKPHLNEILPDPRSVREAHKVASAYIVGKIGEEMIKEGKAFLMLDGTS